MEYKFRTQALFSVCGLNCGLCPRHYTAGSSRCPGCGKEGFSKVHPLCGVLSCCQRKGLEYCFFCNDFPCKKYAKADLVNSFITHKNQFRDIEKAKLIGIEAYEAELNEKTNILNKLLNDYNDGQRKSFFCLAINLLDLTDIKIVIEQLDKEDKIGIQKKEKTQMAVNLFKKMATTKNISLKLRKNQHQKNKSHKT